MILWTRTWPHAKLSSNVIGWCSLDANKSSEGHDVRRYANNVTTGSRMEWPYSFKCNCVMPVLFNKFVSPKQTIFLTLVTNIRQETALILYRFDALLWRRWRFSLLRRDARSIGTQFKKFWEAYCFHLHGARTSTSWSVKADLNAACFSALRKRFDVCQVTNNLNGWYRRTVSYRNTTILRSHCCSVPIITRLKVERPKNVVRFPVGAWVLSFQNSQTVFGCPPSW